MSLKLIELQVALPRTYESSKIQEQLEQRSQQMQDVAALNSKKETDLKQKQVNKNDKNYEANFEEDQSSSSFEGQNKQESKEKKKEQKVHHPYKGNKIDFSG